MTDNKHGYKAYEPGLVCRGYQYEEGKTYKKNGHGVCVGGVTHYCVNPSGDSAKIDISGNASVGAAIGINSIIKGAVGNWITLAEWAYDSDKQRCAPVCVKSAQIDGQIIKADTWYKLTDGEFVEVADE